MFILTTFEDNVRVQPEKLGAPASVAIEDEIARLYFDKLVPDVGLIVSLYDILSIEGGRLHSEDGGAHFDVKFRLIVFRPFEGEVLLGQIQESSPKGVSLSLGFFKDVFIPEQYMQSPGSMYDESQQSWFWKFEGENLWLEKGEVVRFKVREVQFRKVPTAQQAAKMKPSVLGQAAPGTEDNPFQPLYIVGDIDGDGLGCVSWWEGGEDDMDETEA